MGKTAALKKKGGASIHSRAVRRATSPGIDTDKSLKEVQPPSETKPYRPSVLAVHQGAGVSKKTKNGRKSVLSAKAKRRQEKGLDRAEVVMDKKERRVEKSRGKSRAVQDRAKAWEELNKRIMEKKEAERVQKENEERGDENENWVDEEEMHEDSEVGDIVMDTAVRPQEIALPEAAEDEDEIL